MNIRFLSGDLWATAPVCTASSAAAALPAAATQDLQRTSVWRSTAEAAPWVRVDLGTAQAVTAGALADVTVVSGTLASIKLQSSPDASAWTDYATLATANAETRVTAAFGSSLSRRYWRYLFTGSGSVVVDVGTAFVGTYLETTSRNFAIPMDLPLVDPSRVVESLDGQRSTTRRTLYTAGTWKFPGIAAAQRDALIAMLRAQRGPVFVAWNTAVGWGTLLAHLGPAQYPQTLNLTTATTPLYWIDIPFEEAR